MPTAKKRVMLQPDTAALVALGRDIGPDDDGNWTEPTACINGALREYADALTRAAGELAAVLTRPEWNAVADVTNGCADLYDYMDGPHVGPLTMVWANLCDSPEAGAKWGIDVADLTARLRALTPLHGYAILAAVRWFWTHCEGIDHAGDSWWAPAFRAKKDES
jgi:hypothetical protein